jgi:hypothetical protein
MGIKMSRVFMWAATGILLTYFIFTSGLVFALTDQENTQNFTVPYNLALSGENTGLVGIYTEDDIACAKWIADNSAFPVTGDYNARTLLYGYVDNKNVIRPDMPLQNCYMLILKWNTEHGKMITGDYGAGLRGKENLPDITGWKEVYRSGRSVVYQW